MASVAWLARHSAVLLALDRLAEVEDELALIEGSQGWLEPLPARPELSADARACWDALWGLRLELEAGPTDLPEVLERLEGVERRSAQLRATMETAG